MAFVSVPLAAAKLKGAAVVAARCEWQAGSNDCMLVNVAVAPVRFKAACRKMQRLHIVRLIKARE